MTESGGSPLDLPYERGIVGPEGLDGDELANKVHAQFQDAKSYRQQFDKDWGKYYNLYVGRHWNVQVPDWASTPVIPLTFSFIHTVVPILTDNRPQVVVVPRQPEHDKIAAVLGHVVDWIWEKIDLDRLLPKTMVNTLVFGNGFMKVMWDPSARGGLGDIKVISVDPSHIFVSPHARDLDEATYVIHAENLRKDVVERMFPGSTSSSDIGPQHPELTIKRNVTSQSANGGRERLHDIRTTDGSQVVSGVSGSKLKSVPSDDELVTVFERWERQPDGSMMQTVVVNERTVIHRPSPFEHGRYPFVHFVDYDHTWSFWGLGEVQQVEKLQIEINRRRGHLMDILNYAANPILVVDPASGIDYENLPVRPRMVIPAEGGPAGIAWLQAASIPSALFEINAVDKADFDSVLGNVDVLQGRRPEGIEAGVAIELLQEAANVRMRQKVKNMENAIRHLGELLVGMVQQFYTTERVIQIAGQEAFSLEKPITKDPESKFLFLNRPTVDPATGQVVIQNEVPPMSDAEFDVRVGPGSTLPVSRSTMFQKAITLFQMGIMDDEGVYKVSGIPKWREEMERSRAYFQQKQMEALQMQSMAAGMQPPAEPTEEDVSAELDEAGPSDIMEGEEQ